MIIFAARAVCGPAPFQGEIAMRLMLSAILGLSLAASGAALAQTVGGSGAGMNDDNGFMTGANIDTVNGTDANGLPRSQAPGASMTNGPKDGNVLSTQDGGNTLPPNGTAIPTIHATTTPGATPTSGAGQ
jgi:hypothetical protein